MKTDATDLLIEEIKKAVDESRIQFMAEMKQHTTFRVGGPADILVSPGMEQAVDIIALCRQGALPYTIIGNGSNLLVGDLGIRGIVIEFGKNAAGITVKENCIVAEAGALLSKAANAAAEAGLAGMEFAAGIPGSIGGAVVMNAGAYGGEMKDIVKSVRALTRDGKVRTYAGEEMQFAYRHSRAMEEEQIVLSAELILKPGETEQIRAKMNELKEKRLEKQPLEYPSAGSTFKRPEGHFAGKLIMDAGLAGFSVGGAQVSAKHCGFVINTGNATAADILSLMQQVTDRVESRFHVRLEPEVRRIGEFS